MIGQFPDNVHGPFTASGLIQSFVPNFVPDTSRMEIYPKPDELFPPIADEDLYDGRTREGKAQRQFLEHRAAYIKLYEHAMNTNARLSTFRKAFEILGDLYMHNRQVTDRRIFDLNEDLIATPAAAMMIVQLVLLTQIRPEEIVRSQTDVRLAYSFKLGPLGITVMHLGYNMDRVKIVVAGMADKEFHANTKGNFDEDELARLVGHLAMAGITVDPQLVRLVMSMNVETQVYKNTGTTGAPSFLAFVDATTLMRTKH